MPSNSKIPNQANSQTSQNYSIDINTIYSDFIQRIDGIRSIVNINVNKSKLTNFTIQNIAGLSSVLSKVESTPQESRVHAFFRLIGFPVVSADMTYYNPGLDTVSGDKTVTLEDKIAIANNPISGFNPLSLQRENYFQMVQQIFNVQPATITSSALALSSSTNTRKFSVPTTSSDPFDVSPSNQSFTPNLNSLIGKNNIVTLNQYVDALGNTPAPNNLFKTRYHLVKPFIVDARIDFSTNPRSNLVGVPFVPTKKNLFLPGSGSQSIGSGVYVNQPIIQKVVTDRFGQGQGAVLSTAQIDTLQYILNVPTVQNDSLIKQMTSDKYLTSISSQFAYWLYVIQAMCTKLVEAQAQIQLVQSRYYWLPLPSATGPEGGSAVADPIVTDKLPNGANFSFITTLDQDIINFYYAQQGSNFNAQSASLDGTPSLGPFEFDYIPTFASDTTSGYGNNTLDQLNRAMAIRNHDMTIANTALQTIEIIMGEWSGLGLCDIVATMAALYVMPQNSVLGFLDPDAFDRATTSLGLNESNPGITQAQNDFVNSVTDMYQLMDDIYLNIYQNAQKSGLVT
jgi:hypothetical protein